MASIAEATVTVNVRVNPDDAAAVLLEVLEISDPESGAWQGRTDADRLRTIHDLVGSMPYRVTGGES